MKYTLLFAIWLLPILASCQLMWQTVTSPVNTLLHLDMGPNGELATFQNGNPIQPVVSIDGGVTWQTKLGTGGPNSIQWFDQAWHMSNAGSLFFIGSNGSSNSMWRSADGGDTFTMIANPPQHFYFGFHSDTNGEIYLYGDGVSKSTDDGLTWTQILGSSASTQVMGTKTNALYMANNSGMFASLNTGGNYQPYLTGMNSVGGIRDIEFDMNGEMIVAGSSGDILIVSSGVLANWSQLTSGFPQATAISQVAASSVSDDWIAIDHVNVFHTANSGNFWNPLNTGLTLAGNEPIQELWCDANGTFWMYNYSGIYRLDFTTSIPEYGVTEMQAYPNPTEGILYVHGVAGDQLIEVHDLMGHQVYAGVTDLAQGLDLSHLDAGVYFLRESASDRTVRIVLE